MINEQLCFISDKINNRNNKSNISINDSFNKKSAKKYIKFEYYDSMPVYFDILPEIETKEKLGTHIGLMHYTIGQRKGLFVL
jgi:tRNA U34 2-thiouridine synthase MnmA/TrmU